MRPKGGDTPPIIGRQDREGDTWQQRSGGDVGGGLEGNRVDPYSSYPHQREFENIASEPTKGIMNTGDKGRSAFDIERGKNLQTWTSNMDDAGDIDPAWKRRGVDQYGLNR